MVQSVGDGFAQLALGEGDFLQLLENNLELLQNRKGFFFPHLHTFLKTRVGSFQLRFDSIELLDGSQNDFRGIGRLGKRGMKLSPHMSHASNGIQSILSEDLIETAVAINLQKRSFKVFQEVHRTFPGAAHRKIENYLAVG